MIEWLFALERPPPRSTAQPETAGLFGWAQRYNAPMRTLTLLVFLVAGEWSQAQEPPKVQPVAKTNGTQQSPEKNPTAPQNQTSASSNEKIASANTNEELEVNRNLTAFTGELARYTWWLACFTGVLVVVGGLQLFALFWQARTLVHHSELLETSATATRRTSEALMGGQRGWILVENVDAPNIRVVMSPQFETLPIFVFRLKVFGFTPCKIRNAGMRFHLANIKEHHLPPEPDLPETPEYNIAGIAADVPDPGDVLAPRQWFRMTGQLESGAVAREDIPLINESRKFLCAYGFVSYTDTFERQHETRFCYIYRITNRSTRLAEIGMGIDPSRFRIGGPNGYNWQT
jgi:hypothetical protein